MKKSKLIFEMECDKYKGLFMRVVEMAKDYESDCDFGIHCKVFLQAEGYEPNWEDKTLFKAEQEAKK